MQYIISLSCIVIFIFGSCADSNSEIENTYQYGIDCAERTQPPGESPKLQSRYEIDS